MSQNVKTFFIVLGIVVLILLVLPWVWGRGMMGSGMMGSGMMRGSSSGSILNILFWVLLIGGIIWGITRLWRQERKNSSLSPQDSSLDTLKKRYARGEITREEFQERKKELL